MPPQHMLSWKLLKSLVSQRQKVNFGCAKELMHFSSASFKPEKSQMATVLSYQDDSQGIPSPQDHILIAYFYYYFIIGYF